MQILQAQEANPAEIELERELHPSCPAGTTRNSNVRGVDPIDPSHVAASIARELVAAGAAPIQVRAQAVDKVVQTALGKAPLVIGMR